MTSGNKNLLGQAFYGLLQLLLCNFSGEGGFTTPIHRAGKCHLAKHHFGTADVVFIQGNGAAFYGNCSRFCPGLVCRFLIRCSFLQEKDICGDFCSSVFLKRGVWQPDRRYEVGFFGQRFADRRILLVHCVATGD